MWTFKAAIEVDEFVNRNTMYKRWIIDIILTELYWQIGSDVHINFQVMARIIYRWLPGHYYTYQAAIGNVFVPARCDEYAQYDDYTL